MRYLLSFKPEIDTKNYSAFNDDFQLQIGNVESLELTDSFTFIPINEVAVATIVGRGSLINLKAFYQK